MRALTASGFASPEVLRLPMTRKMKSADDLFDAFYKGTARTGGLLRAQSKTSLDAIRAEIQDTAENYKKDGILQIPMPAVIASAVKPQTIGASSKFSIWDLPPGPHVHNPAGVILTLAPGDIAVFGGYTPHRSSPNLSSRTRRLLYLSYNAFSDGGEQRDRHYAEFADWLKDRYAEHGKTMTYFR